MKDYKLSKLEILNQIKFLKGLVAFELAIDLTNYFDTKEDMLIFFKEIESLGYNVIRNKNILHIIWK